MRIGILLHRNGKMNEQLKEQLNTIVDKLDGEVQFFSCTDGRQDWHKIEVVYGKEERSK